VGGGGEGERQKYEERGDGEQERGGDREGEGGGGDENEEGVARLKRYVVACVKDAIQVCERGREGEREGERVQEL